MVSDAFVEAIKGGRSFDDATDLLEPFIPKFACFNADETTDNIGNSATFKKGTFDGVETFYIPLLDKYMIVLEESLDINDVCPTSLH